ncbi:hypothetical protein H5410_036263 [Solanum commersonii]|uniref:F-box domain-containing protein n=1 Tax=Solanum commersonii TaxID=4109 RepID=A0A9J5Y553_SOLCO|nr:hypothetical protein H5410_036263 [Solanum commersonii]
MSIQDQFTGSCGDNGNSESLLIENLPKKKMKIQIECEEIDRISHLPDTLIVQILSRLSIKDVFRKAILSKDCNTSGLLSTTLFRKRSMAIQIAR